jgi:peptide/nickel transport system permease protein
MTIPTSSVEQVIPGQGAMAQPDEAPAGRAKRKRFRFVANAKATTGLVLLGIYILFAVIGPWVAPYDPSAQTEDLIRPPSAQHWFGTTHLGQDIFSQILVGTRTVMVVGLLAGIVATVLSVLVGVTAGYLGGTWDDVLSAVSNVFLVIPALALIIIVASTLDAGDITVALVIGFTSWSWGARVLRAQTLSLRRRDFVEASRANGEKTWRIIGFEIMPNLTAIIASSFVGTVIFAVTSEITLAFIGIGASGDSWNWGEILFWAQSQQALAQHAWWWFVPAGLAIAFLGTALSLINFGIDEFVSPRLRSAGKTSVRTANGRTVRMRVGFTPVLGTSPEPHTLGAAVPAVHPNGATPVTRSEATR